MTTGLNVKIDIYRISYGSDDSSGGAQPSSALLHSNVPARISPRASSLLALEQGMETQRVFSLLIQGQGINIRERDEIRLVWPTDHTFYNQYFRVTTTQVSSRRSRYGAKRFTLERIDRSRSRV